MKFPRLLVTVAAALALVACHAKKEAAGPESPPSVAVRTDRSREQGLAFQRGGRGHRAGEIACRDRGESERSHRGAAGRAGTDGEGWGSDRATRRARDPGQARPGAGFARTGDARSRAKSRVARQKDHHASGVRRRAGAGARGRRSGAGDGDDARLHKSRRALRRDRDAQASRRRRPRRARQTDHRDGRSQCASLRGRRP